LPNGVGGVIAAMGLTFIAFEGYEIIAQSGEEVRNPKRNIPRAIFVSIIIAVVIYLSVAFVALAAIDGQGQPTWQYLGEARETAMVEAARQLLPGGAFLLIVGGLMSTMSALNATVYSSSRVSFAMGRDRVLPDRLGAIHPVRRTPHWAIATSAILIVGMAAALPLEDVASAASIMFLLLFMFVNVSAIVLRRQQPDLDRGYRVPWMPVLPIIGIVTLAGLAVYLYTVSPEAWLLAAVWIGVGAATYGLYARQRSVEPRAPSSKPRSHGRRIFACCCRWPSRSAWNSWRRSRPRWHVLMTAKSWRCTWKSFRRSCR
jgi:amino acid transporter